MPAKLLRGIGTQLIVILIVSLSAAFVHDLLDNGRHLENYFEWCWPMFLCIAFLGLMFRFEGSCDGNISPLNTRIIFLTAGTAVLSMFAINVTLFATSSNPVARSAIYIFSSK